MDRTRMETTFTIFLFTHLEFCSLILCVCYLVTTEISILKSLLKRQSRVYDLIFLNGSDRLRIGFIYVKITVIISVVEL